MTLFQDNRALLDGFRKGDDAALLEVYRACVSDVERLIAGGWYDPKTSARVGRIRDLETQAELIQEVFLKAFSLNARLTYDGIRP